MSRVSPGVDIGGVAVVTGAGSGIGGGDGAAAGRLRATVHATDIDARSAEATAAEVRSRGGTATAHALDVADANAVEVLAAEVFAADGRVDILHNNAGIAHSGPVEETPLEDWRRIVEINLMGVIHGVHAFVPRMLEQGGESQIVNTASGLGLIAGVELAPYCTTKFAVVGLSESLNAELRPARSASPPSAPGSSPPTSSPNRPPAETWLPASSASPTSPVAAPRRTRSPKPSSGRCASGAWSRPSPPPCRPGMDRRRVSLRAGQAAARLTAWRRGCQALTRQVADRHRDEQADHRFVDDPGVGVHPVAHLGEELLGPLPERDDEERREGEKQEVGRGTAADARRGRPRPPGTSRRLSR